MFLKQYNLEVPNAFLAISKTNHVEVSHFVFQYNGPDYIDCTYFDGKDTYKKKWDPYSEEELYDYFFNTKISDLECIPCTLEKYNKIKAFL